MEDYGVLKQVRFSQPENVSFSHGEGYSSSVLFEIPEPDSRDITSFLEWWQQEGCHLSVLFEHPSYVESPNPGSYIVFSRGSLWSLTPKRRKLELLLGYQSCDLLRESSQFLEQHLTI